MARVAGLRAGIERGRSGGGDSGAAARARHCQWDRSTLQCEHAVCQHDSRAAGAAVPRGSRTGAADQELDSLERAGDGGARESRGAQHRRAHFDVCVRGDALRSGLQSFFPRAERGIRRRHGLFSGPRLAGNLCARVSGRTHQRAEAGEFSARTETRGRTLVLSASVADAGLLGISNGVHGLEPAHGDLSGAVQSLSGRSRDETRDGCEGVGIPGRWRDGRAGIAGSDHAGVAREAGQLDFRGQLQFDHENQVVQLLARSWTT